ncbi:MAG: nitrite/sulfite reductase [Acidobacteriota bacterium]
MTAITLPRDAGASDPSARAKTWKQRLNQEIPPSIAREIELYETQMELKRRGKIEDKVFAESRLRRGAYGQRYDNGQRQDGVSSQTLEYPSGDLTKGPNTLWDAPGMHRIKIPFGEVTAPQLETLAELAEEYADGICHVTTRQDVQLHFVHIDDTPDLMRRLAAVGITTREACGNVVRNVTGCPLAGVCHNEAFDVTPYAKALTTFLLGHPDAQDFGRKFKISFSGCADEPCGLGRMHDIGLIAKRQEVDGELRNGFTVFVGGGLGAVPHEAKRFSDFLPAEELLPTTQAICRVFARLGEKRNRARARIKFLIAKLGIDEFLRLVHEEREVLPEDPRWTSLLPEALERPRFELVLPEEGPVGPFAEVYEAWRRQRDGPATEAAPFPDGPYPEGFAAWAKSNVRPQRQNGYHTVVLHLPLGDLTAPQMRRLADLARQYAGGVARTTVEQNMLLRWISGGDLIELYRGLREVRLARPGAGTLIDVTSCPGTDTCKLGISSSRGLASELSRRLAERSFELDEAVQQLRIKISGCFNSCGQHHVADIGFYGVSRKSGNHRVPHFQVVLGGQWSENASAYGLPAVAVPSKNVPAALIYLTDFYVAERERGESFQEFIQRIGRREVRAKLLDLTRMPTFDEDRTFYSDWGDAREYTLADMGVGECAGEVVSAVDFGLAESESTAFEAQIALDAGRIDEAVRGAYTAMVQAAGALTRGELPNLSNDPQEIVRQFKLRFHDTARFHDPFAGAKFANYLFRAHNTGGESLAPDAAHRRIEEAQLFIEAAHACNTRLSQN